MRLRIAPNLSATRHTVGRLPAYRSGAERNRRHPRNPPALARHGHQKKLHGCSPPPLPSRTCCWIGFRQSSTNAAAATPTHATIEPARQLIQE